MLRQDAMTSAQTMRTRLMRMSAAIALAIAGTCCLKACSLEPRLTVPSLLASPYSTPQVWAVAPFTNESGVSIVEGDRVADAFVIEAQWIDGIDTLPVNRVISAMRRLGLHAVTTPAQARSLLQALGADGLIVGSVTAYDPYQPPKFGAAVALFVSDAARTQTLDPTQLTRARTDDISPGMMPDNAPSSQAAGVFDASNHQTLAWLGEYAKGRNEPGSAFGERIYLVRMDLFTQFAAHRLLHDLLVRERTRLTPVQAEAHEGKKDPVSSR